MATTHTSHVTDFSFAPSTANHGFIPTVETLNVSKHYSEIFERMFGHSDDDMSDSPFEAWKDNIRDEIYFHLNEVARMMQFVIRNTEGVSKAKLEAAGLKGMMQGQTVLQFVNDFISSLDEPMAERMYIEFCEPPC